MDGQTLSRQRVLGGAVWSGLSTGSQLLLGIPITVILVRTMARAEYGAYALALSTAGFISVIAGFGLASGVSRVAAFEAAKDETRGAARVLRAGVRLSVFPAVGVCIIAAGVALWFSDNSRLHAVAPVIVALIPVVAVTSLYGVLQGTLVALHQPRKVEGTRILFSVGILLLTLSVILLGFRTAVPIAAVRGVPLVACVTILWWFTRDLRRREVAPGDRSTIRSIFSYSTPMLINGLMVSAIWQLDVTLLGIFRGPKPVALYAPVSSMMIWPLTFFGVVGTYLLPQLTRQVAHEDPDGLRNLYHTASRWGWVLAAPLIGVFLATPSSLLGFLFGTAYMGLAAPTRILTLGALAVILTGFNSQALVAQGNPRTLAWRSGVSLLADVLACAMLIPLFGIIGAATATVIGFATLNFMNSWFFSAPAPHMAVGSSPRVHGR